MCVHLTALIASPLQGKLGLEYIANLEKLAAVLQDHDDYEAVWQLAEMVATNASTLVVEDAMRLAISMLYYYINSEWESLGRLEKLFVPVAYVQYVTGFRGVTDRECKMPKQLEGEEVHVVQVRKVLEYGAAVIREHFAAAVNGVLAGAIPLGNKGAVEPADISLFLETAKCKQPSYNALLTGVKALEIMWRDRARPDHEGYLLWPRQRRMWRVRLSNGMLRNWRGHQYPTWLDWLQANAKKPKPNAKKPERMLHPDFVHVAGELPCAAASSLSRHVSRAGILTDGASLQLYGERAPDKLQRLVARTEKALEADPERARRMLSGPSGDVAPSDDDINYVELKQHLADLRTQYLRYRELWCLAKDKPCGTLPCTVVCWARASRCPAQTFASLARPLRARCASWA